MNRLNNRLAFKVMRKNEACFINSEISVALGL